MPHSMRNSKVVSKFIQAALKEERGRQQHDQANFGHLLIAKDGESPSFDADQSADQDLSNQWHNGVAEVPRIRNLENQNKYEHAVAQLQFKLIVAKVSPIQKQGDEAHNRSDVI